MRKIFKFPKLSLMDICVLGMLLAITVILAVYCTFRIGNQIKIPFKFISIFVASVFFGPWLGGFCGAIGDLLNATLVPVGPLLPQLTALEFLSGFVFGLFFYSQKTNGKSYVLRCILCAAVQFIIDMFLSTLVLTSVGYFPDFNFAFWFRLPAGIVKMLIQLGFMLAGTAFLNPLLRIKRR